ncbi:hypothetical protein B7494_g7301 [Chlorociboria aeruginascens]|nr:hypothetical protein B7494_g7301 [Chlorociboria aeruginascens]
MRIATTVFMLGSALFAANGIGSQGAGSHTDLPRWCGKAYESGSPSFPPGGESTPPPPSPSQLLFVQVEPRYSIYVGSETTGSFIVDATISHLFGAPYQALITGVSTLQKLLFTIRIQGSLEILVVNQVAINSTDNVFDFPLSLLGEPRLEAYSVVLDGVSLDGLQTFSARTEIYYLPEKTTGSVTKIDHLNGGLLFRGASTDGVFESVLPYGFYGDYGGYFSLGNENVQTYYDQGFNVIHLVTSFLDSGPLNETTAYFDQIGLKFIYDMRGSFMNLTAVAEQIPLVKDHDTFLMWYTGDEPDGWEYALNSTTLAYDLISSLDKYHPVSLVLNCQDFYYADYSAGADIILQDTYPIGINSTYSIPYDTNCNLTHGDCGCDNCGGSLLDVPDRLDDLAQYQAWLGEWRKPLWSALQAFDGEGYWQRLPTAEETWVMALLSFNHKARGITSWIYPSTDELNAAHGALAKVVTVTPVKAFLTGAQPVSISVSSLPFLDVSYWTVGNQVMVIIASDSYSETESMVAIELPVSVKEIDDVPWGNVTWSLAGNELQVEGLSSLATSIVILGR